MRDKLGREDRSNNPYSNPVRVEPFDYTKTKQFQELKEGLGRKPLVEWTPMIHINKNLVRRLQRFAKRRNITVEQLANELLKAALDNREWVNLLTMLKEGVK